MAIALRFAERKYLFSANGAILILAWGNAPVFVRNSPALTARFTSDERYVWD
jgi:hypothetical protein